MLNVCMIGHGMMGIWHSEALQRTPDAVLHTVVGRAKPEAGGRRRPAAGRAQSSTEAFAEKYGYKKWTTDLDEALADPEVDIVIIAGPSETHAEMALKSINAGKHTLVEIPIAMNLEGAEAVVAAAKEKGRRARRRAPDALPHRPPRHGAAGEGRGEDPQRTGPVLHPPPAERRRHGPAAQLDRQHPLAPHDAPGRHRAVDGRRAAT